MWQTPVQTHSDFNRLLSVKKQ